MGEPASLSRSPSEGQSVSAVAAQAVQGLNIRLSEGAVWRCLWRATALLLVVGLTSRLARVTLPDFPGRDFLNGLFRLDSEANLPALFATVLLFSAAALFGLIARFKTQAGDRFARTWWGLTWLFLYLAVDENAQLHERPAAFLGDALQTSGFLTYAWVVPYALICVILLISLARFLMDLPRQLRNSLLAAGFLYIVGALGFELIQGQLVWLEDLAVETPLYIVLVTIEEGLEMLGIILLIVTLLGYLRRLLPTPQLTLALEPLSRPLAD